MPTIHEIELHDIVQLSATETANEEFAGCFLVVTELKDWGVVGYVQVIGGGQAYYRAARGTYEKTGGKAVWIVD